MNDLRALQERYFKARLAGLTGKPSLHKNQIEVYNNYLSVLGKSASMEDFSTYVATTGDMVDVAKAEIEDRHTNFAALFRKAGWEDRAKAEELVVQELQKVKTHTQLYESQTEVMQKRNQRIARAQEFLNQCIEFCGVLEAALMSPKGGPGSQYRKGHLETASSQWRTLQERRPGLTLAHLMRFAPLRNATIYTDRQLTLLFGLLEHSNG
ncbi:MAG: hypothetical protein K8S54_00835 [Spirochaetia bacterium]|nr:hypothetical protein [Spirochaetia bacterium]